MAVYIQVNGKPAEIHFKVTVGPSQRITVCGVNTKDSLRYAQFFLDVNAKDIGPNYKPSSSRKAIVGKDSATLARKYIGDECTSLSKLPEGTHVLTVKANPDFLSHASTLTHVITWEQ
jgi:hypothetical protein